MPEPALTLETPPPPPVLVGDTAAELLRAAGFPASFRRWMAFSSALALTPGVLLALLFLTLVYFVASKPPPHVTFDFLIPALILLMAILLLIGGVYLQRIAEGVRAMYAAEGASCWRQHQPPVDTPLPPRINRETAGLLWRTARMASGLTGRLFVLGILLLAQGGGLMIAFADALRTEITHVGRFRLFAVVLLAVISLLVIGSALSGFCLIRGSRALRKLEDLTKEKS